MMRLLLALSGVAALLLMLWPALPVSAQTGGWSEPIELSNAAQTKANVSWYPDLTVGPDGSVHVIWCSFPKIKSDRGSLVAFDSLMYRTLSGTTWSEINDIATRMSSEEYTVRNSIALGRDGKLHVLLRSWTKIVAIDAPWQSAWSARSWSTPRTISGSGAAYYNALAIDDQGILHALWSEAVPDDPNTPNPICPGCSDLFYRRSTDGGKLWSPPINLSQSPDGENRPQIKIDHQGRIHAVWDQGIDWYAGSGQPKLGVYRRSDDGGKTWRVPVNFHLAEDQVIQTALALTLEGNPFVVYRGVNYDRLYFQRSTDGGTTWNHPTEIPGVRAGPINNLDIYSMATDGAGHIHLLMVGFPSDAVDITSEQARPTLFHLTWDGAAWSAPEPIMRDSFMEWPRIVIAGGNQLHAVWFTRRQLQGERYFQIYYSSKQTDAPSTTALPLFTATSLPTSTALPSPVPETPTPTPLVPAALEAPVVDESPAWERTGLVTIGIALLPMIGLLAILSAVVRSVQRHR